MKKPASKKPATLPKLLRTAHRYTRLMMAAALKIALKKSDNAQSRYSIKVSRHLIGSQALSKFLARLLSSAAMKRLIGE